MSVLGIIGIILALFVFIYLGYKGWDVAYVVIIAVVIVAAFNAQNITEAFVSTFMQGAADILINLYPIFITGAIFGAVYSCSGAGDAIAGGISRLFTRDKGSLEGKRGAWGITFICSIVFSLLNYTGIDAMIGLFVMYPIIVGFLRKANIPRKTIPVLLMACYGIANGPGAIQSKQVLAMNVLGTSSTAGLIPGIIGMALVAVLSIPYIAKYIIKCQERGEGFTEYEGDMHFMNGGDVKTPRFIVALIPLAAVFVLFNVFKMNNAIAVLIGTVITAVVCFPQMKANAPKHDILSFLKKTLNKGVINSSKVTIAVLSVVGFGSVVVSTDAFMGLAEKLTHVSVGGYFIFTTATCVLVGLMANSIGGIQIGLPILGKAFVSMGLSATGIHRIAMFAASTFDSLPISMFVIMCHDISGVKLKDGYKPVFIVSVLIPLICTYVIALLYTIYPGWA